MDSLNQMLFVVSEFLAVCLLVTRVHLNLNCCPENIWLIHMGS